MKKFFIMLALAMVVMSQWSFAVSEMNIVKPYDKEGYYIFEQEGKFGICTEEERVVLPATLAIEDLDTKLFILKNDEDLFGVVDDKNQIVVPFEYHRIESEEDSDLIVASREDSSQVIYWYEEGLLKSLDLLDKKLAIRGQNAYHANYFVVVDKKFGNTKIDRMSWDIPYYIMSDSGELIYDKPVEYVFNKQGAYGVVLTKDDLYGLIDENGQWLLEPVYEYISPYDVELKNKSFVIAKKDGFYNGYDLSGQIIVGGNYTHMAYMDPMFVLASKDNNQTQSVLDLQGNVILTVKNKNIQRAMVIDGQTYYVCSVGDDKQIDNVGLLKGNGDWLIKPEFIVVSYRESYGYFDCGKDSHERYYYSKDGRLLSYLSRDNAEAEGDYFVYKQDGFKSNIRIENYYGQVILKGYRIVERFLEEDYYVVYDDDKTYKIMDKTGQVMFRTSDMRFMERVGHMYIFRRYEDDALQVVDAQFNNLGKVFSQLFLCEDEALWGVYEGKLENYDMKGQYRFSIEYDPVEFYNGQLISKAANEAGVGVRSSWDKWGYDPNKLYGLISPQTGDIILDVEYKKIKNMKDNYYSISDHDDQWGLVNNKGEWLVELSYTEIHERYNYDLKKTTYFVVVTEDEYRGLIDVSGNMLLPADYKAIGREVRPYDYIIDQYTYNLRSTGKDYMSKARD